MRFSKYLDSSNEFVEWEKDGVLAAETVGIAADPGVHVDVDIGGGSGVVPEGKPSVRVYQGSHC